MHQRTHVLFATAAATLLAALSAAPANAWPDAPFTPRECPGDPAAAPLWAEMRRIDAAPPTDLTAEIAARFRIDQGSREALFAAMKATGADAEERRICAASAMVAIDASNGRALERRFPGASWFDAGGDPEAMRQAATILQHHPDEAFMAAKLPRFAAIARAGPGYGGPYARLHDRVAVQAGRPQRYGTQARCDAGRTALFPIEDEAAVDRLRDAIHFEERLARTRERLAVGEAG